MWNEVDKNNRMYNDMRFLDWHQHLVLWARSTVPCLLNSIKHQFFPRRQRQARGWTDAHWLLSTFSRSRHCSDIIVAIVTGNANYVSHHLIPKCLNRANVRDPGSWHGPGHSTDELEKIEIWHKPPASLSNNQGEGGWELEHIGRGEACIILLLDIQTSELLSSLYLIQRQEGASHHAYFMFYLSKKDECISRLRKFSCLYGLEVISLLVC